MEGHPFSKEVQAECEMSKGTDDGDEDDDDDDSDDDNDDGQHYDAQVRAVRDMDEGAEITANYVDR